MYKSITKDTKKRKRKHTSKHKEHVRVARQPILETERIPRAGEEEEEAAAAEEAEEEEEEGAWLQREENET